MDHKYIAPLSCLCQVTTQRTPALLDSYMSSKPTVLLSEYSLPLSTSSLPPDQVVSLAKPGKLPAGSTELTFTVDLR